MGADSIAPNEAGQFVNTAYWNWNDGKLKFNSRNVDNANENCGSVSARLPVCL